VGTSLTVTNNTVISGNSAGDGNGGGVLINQINSNYVGGDFTFTNSSVTGNSAASGGAIYCSVPAFATGHQPLLIMSGSTIGPNNSATNVGGGIAIVQPSSGSTTSNPTNQMVNCTIAGNSAAVAGAVYVQNYVQPPATIIPLLVNFCTIATNTSTTTDGGGVTVTANSVLQIQNTIVAKNNPTVSPTPSDVSGAVTSLGYNLIGNGDASSGWVGHDLLGTGASPIDPKLGALQNNGGPTYTMLPKQSSQAVNAADPTTPMSMLDQRGLPRFPTGDPLPDIGAVERQPNDGTGPGGGDLPLHEGLAEVLGAMTEDGATNSKKLLASGVDQYLSGIPG
jgi:predicted outer membrane repeat protein